jgi:phytanoyl-CoA hydroxylase
MADAFRAETLRARTFGREQDATQEHYKSHGYVVLQGLIQTEKIDNLIQIYSDQIVPSKSMFFRQNTNKYERNQFTSGGHVVQSFMDIHKYDKFPEFKQAALDIFFSREMLVALPEVTGFESHNLMAAMLFDANTTTPAHQDWWYLDSVPPGHLVGAWIALEDINEAAGRFFVVPGSQDLVLHEPGMRSSSWLARIATYVESHADEVVAPMLAKGDVLFWNSRTIHGSLPTQDRKYSRKSLTAHFLPAEMAFGNLFKTKPWIKYETYQGHKYFGNQPEFSLAAQLASAIKQALCDRPRLLALARKFQYRSLS